MAVSARFGNDPPAVPLIAIGDEAIVGFDTAATTGAVVEQRVAACLASSCVDVAGPIVAGVLAGRIAGGQGGTATKRSGLPAEIRIPLIGPVDVRALSLPVLTVVLAAVDGFNPCAMWVLVFLIGLLLGMEDRVRMWSYGAAFLVTSGAVYLLFMAAWLNVFLFLGALVWVRVAVGVFALAAGAYYLVAFVRNPDAACTVVSSEQKTRVMDRLKGLVSERSFLLAVSGIMVLAVAVNLIELLCSAGIPAVYTQVLALSDLSRAAHFAFLLLYVTVFMLDDAIVFVAAMATIQASGLATSYSRWSHLVGGAVLLVIGALLVAKPEWLA